MKIVTIQALHLEHFKGISDLEIDFLGHGGSIYGRNGTGKSTIMDAWMWLLTGKDAAGNADFEIKPLNMDGEVADHDQRTVVSARIALDGQTHELRREYYELWQTRRGDAEPVYSGNSTDFFVDDVPRSKRDYEAWIEEQIASRSCLRYLCDVGAFAAAKWQDRREILFELADIGSDAEIMALDRRFELLAEATEGITLSDLRTKLRTQRKKLVSRSNDIPAQIQENQRMLGTLGAIDFDTLERQISALELELDDIHAQLRAAGTTSEQDSLQVQMDRLQLERDQLEQKNREYRSALAAASLDRNNLERRLEQLTRELEAELKHYRLARADAESYEAQLAELREKWTAANAAKWTGSDTCPTCGQKLPEARIEKYKAAFEKEKKGTLKDLEQRAAEITARIEHVKETAARTQDYCVQLEGEIAKGKSELEQMPPAVPVEDMEGYAQQKADLQRRVDEITAQQKQLSRGRSNRRLDLMTRQSELEKQHRELLTELGKRGTISTIGDRICELEDERRKLAGEMAEMDRVLDLADDFLLFRTKYITDQVNGKFILAEFRMFTVQVNGGIAECCDILCRGVPYDGGLNNGARINVGLDIIRTLSAHYGVQLPIFVDNAESVNKLEDIGGQLIRLVVTEENDELEVELA